MSPANVVERVNSYIVIWVTRKTCIRNRRSFGLFSDATRFENSCGYKKRSRCVGRGAAPDVRKENVRNTAAVRKYREFRPTMGVRPKIDGPPGGDKIRNGHNFRADRSSSLPSSS